MPSHRGDLELGVSGVVTVVVVIFVPILVFVVRWKWMLAAARQDEIKRLVRYAEEEAARAEIEYKSVYRSELESNGEFSFYGAGGVSFVGAGDGEARLCAVCYSPTTTRCSRCKVVRYCSGKCQIAHWRQGHKDECRRPAAVHRDALGSCSDLKTARATESRLTSVVSDNNVAEAAESHIKKDAPSDSFFTSNQLEKEDLDVRNPVAMPNTNISSSCSRDINGDSGSVKHVFLNPTDLGRHFFNEITSNSSKSTHSDLATVTSSVNSSCIGKLSHQTGGSGNEDSFGFTSLGQDTSSLSSLNCNDGRGDFSKTRDGQNDATPDFNEKQDISKNSSSILPSQSKSGSRKDHDGFVGSMNRNASLPGRNISSSYYFDRSSSADGRKDGKFLLKPTLYRSPSNGSASTSTLVSGGNRVPGSSLPRASTPPVQTVRNTVSAANGNHASKSSVWKVVELLKSSKPSNPDKMLAPYDLYRKLYSEKVELQPHGLTNCGNSCYANAILQCLMFTRPLTAYLLQGSHSKTCPKEAWCFTCELENLVLKVKQGKSPLSPIKIVSQIHNLGSSLGPGKEEDAHEFLRCAIDAMQKAFMRETGKLVGSISDEITLIQLIFGGYLRSKIRCMRCQGTSEQYERMMDLTVEIGHVDINTLEQALGRFTAREILDGENKYKCSRCKSYEKASKRLSLLEAPNVLTIALKRFQSGKFGKLNKTLQFPEILDMGKYMSSASRDKSPVYCLFAVVVHIDIMNAAFSGHYVCYVKNTQGKWYKIDDSTVKPVELDRVFSKEAYMLFYARISPRFPSSIRSTVSLNSRRYPETVNFGTDKNSGDRSRLDHLNDSVPTVNLDSRSGRFSVPYGTRKVEYSSSENSSTLSVSDEGSCSTESTRDSTSTTDFSDHLFGDSGLFSWSSSPSSFSEESDGFITCSPLSSQDLSEAIPNGHLTDLSTDRSSSDQNGNLYRGVSYTSGSSNHQVGTFQHQAERKAIFQGESSHILPSDVTKQYRRLTERCSGRSIETISDDPRKVKSGLFTRTTRDNSAQRRR